VRAPSCPPLDANSFYANIRYSDGRENSVSVSDLSPCPKGSRQSDVELHQNLPVDEEPLAIPQQLNDNAFDDDSSSSTPATTPCPLTSQETSPDRTNENIEALGDESSALRRSTRSTKSVPPVRYGYSFSHYRRKNVIKL